MDSLGIYSRLQDLEGLRSSYSRTRTRLPTVFRRRSRIGRQRVPYFLWASRLFRGAFRARICDLGGLLKVESAFFRSSFRSARATHFPQVSRLLCSPVRRLTNISFELSSTIER